MIETAENVQKKVWTEEEIQALPDAGSKYEIIDGELVMSDLFKPRDWE